MLDFPVYYPTKLAPGSTITDDSRAFPIDGPGTDVYHGYKMVAATTSDGYSAYYGVSGTDWMDPPILQNPDETKTINGQEYLESWDGDQLRLVGLEDGQSLLLDRQHPAERAHPGPDARDRGVDAQVHRLRAPSGPGRHHWSAMSEQAQIGVIGVGWVGLVTAACFAELGQRGRARWTSTPRRSRLWRAARRRSTSPGSTSCSSATASACGSPPTWTRCSAPPGFCSAAWTRRPRTRATRTSRGSRRSSHSSRATASTRWS